MKLKPVDVAKRIKNLASLPDVCIKINEVANEPFTSTQDMKQIIETDPALAAKLLQIANSPFYGYSMETDDLNRAIMLIGTQGLRDLVWATCSISSFAKLDNSIVDMRTFWEHSLYAATASKVLANKCHVISQDRIFLCGLLHDIGHLALYHVMPEEMEVAFARVLDTDERLSLAEKNVFGFTHSTIGYALLELWKLPENITQTVRYHHQPGKCEDHRLDAAIVHIADNIAKIAGKKGNYLDSDIHFDKNAWKITGLTDKIIDSVIQITEEQYQTAVSLYLKDISMAPAA